MDHELIQIGDSGREKTGSLGKEHVVSRTVELKARPVFEIRGRVACKGQGVWKDKGRGTNVLKLVTLLPGGNLLWAACSAEVKTLQRMNLGHCGK